MKPTYTNHPSITSHHLLILNPIKALMAMNGPLICLPIPPYRIGILPMYRIIAHHQLLLAQPQRHHHPNHQTYRRRHHHIPSSNEQYPHHLHAHLPEPGPNPPILQRENQPDEFRPAECTRDAVRVENGERVVDLFEKANAFVENHHSEPRNAAGEKADEKGRTGLDEAGGGGYGDETGDHALDGADDGWFAEEGDV
ncbi:hypothetical protein IEQ34_006981 [Dendrobium chrysotoxum]|uniref:Uncharacterized protein n=1 Tax=Dendrobium chrysotoxum TaxID=161865 RepID=A0AAV7H9N6_DENCH|nr:hypothetical protein IEQ34_006981 [Dendrobium chrysotoxum]